MLYNKVFEELNNNTTLDKKIQLFIQSMERNSIVLCEYILNFMTPSQVRSAYKKNPDVFEDKFKFICIETYPELSNLFVMSDIYKSLNRQDLSLINALPNKDSSDMTPIEQIVLFANEPKEFLAIMKSKDFTKEQKWSALKFTIDNVHNVKPCYEFFIYLCNDNDLMDYIVNADEKFFISLTKAACEYTLLSEDFILAILLNLLDLETIKFNKSCFDWCYSWATRDKSESSFVLRSDALLCLYEKLDDLDTQLNCVMELLDIELSGKQNKLVKTMLKIVS